MSSPVQINVNTLNALACAGNYVIESHVISRAKRS